MSLRRHLQRNRKAERSLENDRLGTPANTSNVTTAPAHTLPGSDSVRLPDETDFSLTDTLGALEITTPDYSKRPYGNMFSPHFSFCSILLVYYRIYAEDGAIPSNSPVTASDPFLVRIKVRSVSPPRTLKAVKLCIAKFENIKDRESTSLFLTPYIQSPLEDADKLTILNGAGAGSNTPQEPLALVAMMSDSERSDLESGRRGGLANAATYPGIRYGTSIQQSPYLFVLLNCWEKCNINSTPMILKWLRK